MSNTNPQVIHTSHDEGDVFDGDFIYVGLISMEYGPQLNFRKHVEFLRDFEPGYLENIKGKDLICDCSQGKTCHALVLLEMANPSEQLTLELF